jgi:4-hydroxybenzoate polyprenyltransferase
MMGLVTGSTAYGFGASIRNVLLAGLAAMFLALGGFYIDYLADWRKDKASGKTLNPIAAGEMSGAMGAVFAVVGIVASALLGYVVNPFILLPAVGVLFFVVGMATGILETPVLRAIGLGAIQGLYVVVGGLAARNFGWGIVFTALFLFFAMTGGRVMGEVRDLPHDSKVNTATIPLRYDRRWMSTFLLVNEVIAYIFALSVYFVGALGLGYLVCILAVIVAGMAINLVFVLNPAPRIADRTNKLSFGMLGMLYVLGMILGRR